ncbi:hypothetical protein LX36DRAFT_150062 [Colletotrichum falcatum]|nr:hypothetical protein LX36DRAFT_150062 [Colletotrichum falcatum]
MPLSRHRSEATQVHQWFLYLQGRRFNPRLFSLTLHDPLTHFGASVLPILADRRDAPDNLCSPRQTNPNRVPPSSAPLPFFLNHRQSRQPKESLHDILHMTLTTFVCHSRRNVENENPSNRNRREYA